MGKDFVVEFYVYFRYQRHSLFFKRGIEGEEIFTRENLKGLAFFYLEKL